MKKLIINKPLFFLVFFILIISCNHKKEYIIPKSIGYFRLDLPEKQYQKFDSILPFTFEIPDYSLVLIDTEKKVNNFIWFNIVFPTFQGKLHCSYTTLNKNLYTYTEDAHTFVYKHVPKADDIEVKPFSDKEHQVYGLIYYINGIGAASPCTKTNKGRLLIVSPMGMYKSKSS